MREVVLGRLGVCVNCGHVVGRFLVELPWLHASGLGHSCDCFFGDCGCGDPCKK